MNGLNISAKWVFDTTEPEDLALYAEAIPKLVAVGMKISPDFLHEKLKIPMAEGGSEMKSKPLAPLSPLPPFKGGKATALSLAPFGGGGETQWSGGGAFTPNQQIIENLADKVLEKLNSPIPEGAIFNAIKGAKNYEDLADRLAVLFVDTDTAEFRNMLERATFAADCLGYAHA